MMTTQIKHNDVKYIMGAAKYHSFPNTKTVKEPVKLRTKLIVSQDYTVKTLEDLV